MALEAKMFYDFLLFLLTDDLYLLPDLMNDLCLYVRVCLSLITAERAGLIIVTGTNILL